MSFESVLFPPQCSLTSDAKANIVSQIAREKIVKKHSQQADIYVLGQGRTNFRHVFWCTSYQKKSVLIYFKTFWLPIMPRMNVAWLTVAASLRNCDLTQYEIKAIFEPIEAQIASAAAEKASSAVEQPGQQFTGEYVYYRNQFLQPRCNKPSFWIFY